MPDAVFNADLYTEDVDLEAKRAGGRDGKGALPDNVWETYSAFANTDGVLADFWNQVNNPQKVSRNLISHHSVAKHALPEGRWVIAIQVPRASRKERPVFINGNPLTGTFKRQQSGDYRCTEDEVKRMLAEQTEDERDARIVPGFTFDDIDISSFNAYRNRLAALKPDHPYLGASNLEFMRKVGGWRQDRETGDEGMTLAGLLMFGKHESIHEAMPNYFVDYRELPFGGTKTEWVDRLTPDGTWSGNLYDFYRSAIQRLSRDLKVPFRLEGDEREDDTAVHKALREALVNAIVHADYSARISILVVKAPGYFGFRNPGRMRIPIDKALEGGHSDCRNRSLQRMFSLIGLGEQAGSGIPRVLENWKTQHYRAPELWETLEPEATLIRMRTVSLLPDSTLEELRSRFGQAFDGLGEDERLAVATAQIEGFVSNGRMQQLCRLHPRDITSLLKKMEDQGFLVHDGQGRGTTYRIAGTEAVDLAGAVDLADPAGSSAHLPPSSAHLPPSSAHLGSEPEPSEPTPEDLVDHPELLQIAESFRANRKAAPATTRATILNLCSGRFLTLNELGKLMDRSANGLRQRFIKPMVDTEKVLERRFPQQPNHEQQAYRTREL